MVKANENTTTLVPKKNNVLIDDNTVIGSKNDLSILDNSPKVDNPSDGTYDKFLTASRSDDIDLYNFEAKKKARVQEKLAQGFTFYDAVKDTAVGQAFRKLDLSSYDWENGPQGELTELSIDTERMRAKINSSEETEDTKIRYNKALNVLANANNRGMKVIRSNDGRYWLESEEGGKKNYAINGLLDIREVVNKFHGKAPDDVIDDTDTTDTETDTKTEDITKEVISEEGIDVPAEAIEDFKFTEAEKWYLGGFAADVVTTVGGMATKGAAGAGSLVSFIGGLFSVGAEARGDYLSGKTWGEMAGNAATRIGLEAIEAVSIIPASLLGKLRKGAPIFRIMKRGMQALVGLNAVDVATQTRWSDLIDKVTTSPSELTIDDWREITRAVTAVAGLTGAVASNRGKVDSAVKVYKNPKTKVRTNTELTKEATSKKLGIKSRSEYLAVEKANDAGFKSLDAEISGKSNSLKSKARESASAIKKSYNTSITKTTSKIKPVSDNVKPVKGETQKEAVLRRKSNNANKKNKSDNQLVEKDIKKLESNKKRDQKSNADKYISDRKTLKSDKKLIESEVKNTSLKKRREDIISKRDVKIAKGKAEDNKALLKERNLQEEKINKAYGDIRGKKVLKKARKKADIKETKVKYDEANHNKLKAKKKANSKELKDLKKSIKKKGSEKVNVKETKTKIAAIEEDQKKLIAKIDKEVENSGGKWYKKYPKKAGDLVDVPLSFISPAKNFSNFASLKSIANSDSFLGKGKKHYIPKTDDNATLYLKQAGYKESEISKLTLIQKQNAIRYIKYNSGKVDKKQQGGKLKSMIKLVKKEKVYKAQAGTKVYITENGEESSTPTQAWIIEGDSSTVYTIRKDGTIVKLPATSFFNRNNPVKNIQKELVPKVQNPIYSRITEVPESKNTIPGVTYLTINGDPSPEGVRTDWWELNTPQGKARFKTKGAPNTPFTMMDEVVIQGIKTPTNDVDVLDNLTEIELTEAEKAAAASAENERELEEVRTKYNQLRASKGYRVLDPKATDLFKFLDNIKPSDFMFRGDIITEGYIRNPILAAITQSLPLKSMAGLSSAITTGRRSPSVSTSDAFTRFAYNQRGHKTGVENTNKLVERNNAFVEQQRNAQVTNANRNAQAAINAENQNIMAGNQDAVMTAQTRLKARTDRDNYNSKLTGNILNGAARMGQSYLVDKNKDKYRDELDNLHVLNDIYEKEYMPLIVNESSKGNLKGVYEAKSRFMQEQGMDPDAVKQGIQSINSRLGI